MIDYQGDTIVRDSKRRKILGDQEVCEIKVSQDCYAAAISSIIATN